MTVFYIARNFALENKIKVKLLLWLITYNAMTTLGGVELSITFTPQLFCSGGTDISTH
jgi:hypothetical protein